MMSSVRILALAAVAALAGCTTGSTGGGAPTSRLTWLTYLSGEDLRAVCLPDRPDRFRLVYNADDRRHVFAYEIVVAADGALVEARSFPAVDLTHLDLSAPLDPARGQVARLWLRPPLVVDLVHRLADAGVFDEGDTRFDLPSSGPFWVVSGCHAGGYFRAAYDQPGRPFGEVLL